MQNFPVGQRKINEISGTKIRDLCSYVRRKNISLIRNEVARQAQVCRA